MDTAKVFAAVLAAAIGFVAKALTDKPAPRPVLGAAGLALLGLSTVLYLVTMFWYDRLLMPTRFWSAAPSRYEAHAANRPRPSRPLCSRHVLRRPPSSATWVLYQNMQLVWAWCFVPATLAAGAGTGLYVAAIADIGWTWVLVLEAMLGVATVFILALVGRPRLGVND
jgi:hypothetical protein